MNCNRMVGSKNPSEIQIGNLKIRKPSLVATLSRDVDHWAPIAAGMGADMVEVRLDLLPGDPVEEVKQVRSLTQLPVLVTNRLAAEGGGFKGSEEERLDILLQASEHAHLVDVELQAPGREYFMKSVKRPVMVSFHDFRSIPGDVQGILGRAFSTGAPMVKMALTPQTLGDALKMMELLLASPVPLAMIGMGEVGRHLRLMAPVYGSVLTYGYLGSAAAPGQFHVQELRSAMDFLGL